jgi:HK97 family phage major capsid protein
MSDFEQKHIEALEALRKGVSAEMEVKINSLLDAQEEKNQAKLRELSQKAAKAEELEEKMNSLEADLKRGLGGEEKAAKTQELKGFEVLLKKGLVNTRGSEEFKYLRSDNNEDGGYLAPYEYMNEIIKKITEISPVRQVSRVISTSSKEIRIPKRTGLVSGGWVGEGQTSTQSNSTYGDEVLKAEKMMVFTDITLELLRDSAFDMRREITADVAEDFAKLEGAAFVNGNAVSKPEGLLTNADVGFVVSGAASGLIADALYEIQGEIPTGYNLTWMFNRKTLHKHIRTLKDGSGQYLFQANLGAKDMPNTVAGLPYVLANDMPDVAANTFPIIVGDYRKAYYIVDNQNIEFLEDPYTQATSGKRRFIVFKRTGGQVVLAEALKKLKISL